MNSVFILYYYLLLKLDLIFNFDEINNVEIEKHECNIIKGLVGMNRNINLLLLGFHKSYRDTREVFYFYFFSLNF
jgi:hypothetical protein